MKKINKWTMENRRMYLDGVLLDRKVKSFSYNANADIDVIRIECYKEDENGLVIRDYKPVMDVLEFELGRNDSNESEIKPTQQKH